MTRSTYSIAKTLITVVSTFEAHDIRHSNNGCMRMTRENFQLLSTRAIYDIIYDNGILRSVPGRFSEVMLC